MNQHKVKVIAARMLATIAVFITLTSCEGRKMSNMEPTGETVEVVVGTDTTTPADGAPEDSAAVI